MIRQLQRGEDLALVRDTDPNFTGALAKGLMILQVFLREPRPYANSELAALTGLPRPTMSRLCRTLTEMGYLERDERIDRYFVGPAAVTLGYPYIASVPMRAQARPAMQALANYVRGAVSIGVVMGLDVVYIETCAYLRGTLARPDVGAVRSVAETAMGRAWLGSLSKPQLKSALETLRRERPDQMARCAAAIQASLATQARHGFSTNFGDAGFGIQGVGVSSRIRQGTRFLLFNCAIASTQVRGERLVDQVGPRLVELVRMCERNAGIS